MPKYGAAQGKKMPVPQTEISVHSPVSKAVVSGVDAILDSGAAMTAIPSSLVPELGDCLEIGWRKLTTPLGEELWRRIFTVHLKVGPCDFKEHKVIEIERPYAIIGRDILNRYRVVLDGPAKEWTHGPSSACVPSPGPQ